MSSDSSDQCPKTNAKAQSSETKNGSPKHHSHNRSHSHGGTEPPFDMRRVCTLFEAAVIERKDGVNEEVKLQEYVNAWRELNRMFPLFGRLFSFVQSDVDDKEQILQKYIDADPANFQTVTSMCECETGRNTHKSLDPPSASRTFLRLHRAQLFVIELVRNVSTASDDDSMAVIGRKSYTSTLSKHHTWIVRQAVHIALHMLPYRKQLIRQLAGLPSDDQMPHPEEVTQLMDRLVTSGQRVYDAAQNTLEQYQCTDLP